MEETTEDGVKERFKINIWKDILKEFIKEKKFLIGAMVSAFCVGLFEVGMSFFIRYIIDFFIVERDASVFVLFIIISAILLISMFFALFFYIWFAGRMRARVLHNLRVKIFNKYQLLSLSFYDVNGVGHLMARVTSDISQISDVIAWAFTDTTWQISVLIFTFIAMLILNIKLTLIALVSIPLMMLLSWKLNDKILRRNREVRKLNSQIISTYNENIKGFLTAKTLEREEMNDEAFSNLSRKMKESSVKATCMMALMPLLISSVSNIAYFFVDLVGASEVMGGVITIGTFMSYIALLVQIINPVAWFADMFAWIVSAQASVERVISIFNEKVEISDSEDAKKNYGNEELKNKIIKGGVRFEDVSFEYKKGEPILEHFNLEVAPGETVALVGATGAGKSTIVNLFCHFYEPVSGKITLGDVDYKEIPQKWIHDNLGYALQTPYLFTGSILENIRYGNLNAKDEEIIDALKLVGASSFIENLKDGYNAQLGEDGAILSTGQKQLLSLARILVRDPAFFVLDEATSYIDTETEQIVQKAIDLTLKGRTSFVIAHRLSTIKNASKIVVIEKGRVLESGSHEELLAKKGAYYEYYKKQFIEDAEYRK